MNSRNTIILAGLAGVALGAVAVEALNAQTKPPAYVVIEQEVTDADKFNNVFSPRVPATIQASGGRYVARGGKAVSLEGDAPKRIVILGFDSLEAAQGWHASPAMQELIKIRNEAAKARSYAIEVLAK
jgi:uncharacterized protein (DUF1330 family)